MEFCFREETCLGRKVSGNLLQNEGHAEEERDRGEGDEGNEGEEGDGGIKGKEENEGFERGSEGAEEKKRTNC